nr:MAG TPA_asm: ASCH domain protein [Caudoviricetes sp.]
MKKLMFNDRYDLTQAVIEGRKTMTRRVISGGQLLPEDRIEDASICPDGFVSIIANGGESLMEVKCHYKVGEIVAVAQRYYYVVSSGCDIPVDGMDRTPGWRNKMFVRADLMPHQIRITGIKCERLQDISEADCLKEGIRQAYAESILGMYGYIDHKGTGLWFNTPREAFASLIDKVSGRGTWASNPWVVAYEFELVK